MHRRWQAFKKVFGNSGVEGRWLDVKKYIGAVILLGIFLAAKVAIDSGGKDAGPDLTRPDYLDGDRTVNVEAHIGEEKIPLVIDIEPKQLKSREVYRMFEEARQDIEAAMAADNESLCCITGDLELPREYKEISVFWLSSDERLIGIDGKVHPYELMIGESQSVILTAVLTYGEYRMEYDFDVAVVCQAPSSLEEREKWLGTRIRQELANQADSDAIELPVNIEGIEVTYALPENTNSSVVGILFLAVLALTVAKRMERKASEKARMRQMDIDYCEVVSKLTLLMGAGLTIRNAWERIVDEYRSKEKRTGTRYVYEEMCITVNELASGVMERVVYENFGRRCNTPKYIKLGSLLEQNFLKGSKHLLKLLEEESDRAFEERKLLAKKQGEEASTKLLLPMVMELIAVMAIVMVPALMTF